MARRIQNTLQVTRAKVVPKVTSDTASKDVYESVSLNLFDIDPHVESETPLHIAIELDQLEDSDE